MFCVLFSCWRINAYNIYIYTFCWFECRRHSMANCSWIVRNTEALLSQWRAIGNYHLSFEWYHRWPPPFPKIRSPRCTAQDQLRDACCHLANVVEGQCRLLPNYFGPRRLHNFHSHKSLSCPCYNWKLLASCTMFDKLTFWSITYY